MHSNELIDLCNDLLNGCIVEIEMKDLNDLLQQLICENGQQVLRINLVNDKYQISLDY